MNGAARRGTGIVHRVLLALLLGGSLLLAAGCSSMRLAYQNADTLVWWWLDGYVDFDRDQKPAAKAAVAQWLAWHRRTQLPHYREWLHQTATLMQGEPSGEQLCARLTAADPWRGEMLAPLAQPVAEIGRRLKPAQREHLERRFEEKNREWTDKYFPSDPQRRREAAADRAIEHAERLYGHLDRTQRRWLTQRVAGSPWRAEDDLTERQQRQRDALSTLRALAQPGVTPEQARRIAAAWMARLAEPVDPAHGESRDAARRYLCQMAADFHRDLATPAQRQHLQRVLLGWAQDIDSFLVIQNPKDTSL